MLRSLTGAAQQECGWSAPNPSNLEENLDVPSCQVFGRVLVSRHSVSVSGPLIFATSRPFRNGSRDAYGESAGRKSLSRAVFSY